MHDLKALKQKLSKKLGKERFRHSENVEELSAKLANAWGEPEDKARLAGLLHDVSRYLNGAGMLDLAKEHGIVYGPLEIKEPKLLHPLLSSRIAEIEFGVMDAYVLKAIERHTTGAPGMSTLDKIIYLADHTEPSREYDGVAEVRAQSFKDINKAIVACTSAMLRYLLSEGLPIHPATVETRNYYLLNK